MLEMKEERIKELELQIEDMKKILIEGKCTINTYYYYNAYESVYYYSRSYTKHVINEYAKKMYYRIFSVI